MEEKRFYKGIEEYITDERNGARLVKNIRESAERKGNIVFFDTNQFSYSSTLINEGNPSEEDIKKVIEYNEGLFAFLKEKLVLVPTSIRTEIWGRFNEESNYRNHSKVNNFKETFNEYLKVADEIMKFVNPLNNTDENFAEIEEIPLELTAQVRFLSLIYETQGDKKFSEADVELVSLAILYGIIQDEPVIVYSNDGDIHRTMKKVYSISTSPNVGGNDTVSVDKLRRARINIYGLENRRMGYPFESELYELRKWEFRNGIRSHENEIKLNLSETLRAIDKQQGWKIEQKPLEEPEKSKVVEEKVVIEEPAAVKSDIERVDPDSIKKLSGEDLSDRIKKYEEYEEQIKTDCKLLETEKGCRRIAELYTDIREHTDDLGSVVSEGYDSKINQLAGLISDKGKQIDEICKQYGLNVNEVIEEYAGIIVGEPSQSHLNGFDDKTKKAISYLTKEGYDVTEEGVEIPKKVLIKAVGRASVPSLDNCVYKHKKEGIEFKDAGRGKIFVTLDNIYLFMNKKRKK